jgi:transcriptional regulator with XRE-family HTH domain
MPINAETLKTHRAGMSMKRLAQEANVDRRTIARIETGEIAPERVRDETVRRLARALGMTPETLAKPPDYEAQRDAELRSSGYRTVRTILDGRTAVSFALVVERYGISPQRQIEMAPLFTTLLAEMSFADRRRRLDAANAAFNEAIAKLPGHLGHSGLADARFNDAYCDEDSSINAKDLFGRQILREGSGCVPPFREDEGNPFFDFLEQQVEMLGERLGEEIAVFTEPAQDGLPRQPDVLESHLMKTVCGGNHWGSRTLVDGHVRIRDIPAEQWKASPAERGAWLEAQYPQDVRAKKEAELARLDRELSELLEIDEKSDD